MKSSKAKSLKMKNGNNHAKVQNIEDKHITISFSSKVSNDKGSWKAVVQKCIASYEPKSILVKLHSDQPEPIESEVKKISIKGDSVIKKTNIDPLKAVVKVLKVWNKDEVQKQLGATDIQLLTEREDEFAIFLVTFKSEKDTLKAEKNIQSKPNMSYRPYHVSSQKNRSSRKPSKKRKVE